MISRTQRTGTLFFNAKKWKVKKNEFTIHVKALSQTSLSFHCCNCRINVLLFFLAHTATGRDHKATLSQQTLIGRRVKGLVGLCNMIHPSLQRVGNAKVPHWHTEKNDISRLALINEALGKLPVLHHI